MSGALSPVSKEAQAHAEQYYESVRKMKTDVKNISNNTGFSESDILQIKNHVFIEEHDLGGDVPERFYPNYAMAQSWQRLIDGKNIQKHDITLLHHEKMESDLMKKGLSQLKAHRISEKKYNYAKESREYYAEVNKHSNRTKKIEADYIPENSDKSAHITLDIKTRDYAAENIKEFGSEYGRMAANGLIRTLDELKSGKRKEIPSERVVMWY